MIVYLLWHSYPKEPADDNAKLLGVYSTEEIAQQRIDVKYRSLPGFCNGMGEFIIDPYEIDRDHWEQGFARMVNIMIPVHDASDSQWCCVTSEQIGIDRYVVLSSDDAEDEQRWEFKPGQVVTCEGREIDGIQDCLTAVRLAD